MPGVDDRFLVILMALFELAVLAIVIERGLTFFFNWRWIRPLHGYGLRVPFAFAISFLICWWHDFDIIARILDPNAQTLVGISISAAILAGGSRGVMEMIKQLKEARQTTTSGVRAGSDGSQ